MIYTTKKGKRYEIVAVYRDTAWSVGKLDDEGMLVGDLEYWSDGDGYERNYYEALELKEGETDATDGNIHEYYDRSKQFDANLEKLKEKLERI